MSMVGDRIRILNHSRDIAGRDVTEHLDLLNKMKKCVSCRQIARASISVLWYPKEKIAKDMSAMSDAEGIWGKKIQKDAATTDAPEELNMTDSFFG